MNIKRLSILGISALGVLSTSCSAIIGDRVQAGYVGLLINQYGDEETRGIDNAEFHEGGRVVYNGVNKELVLFPTFVQKYSFTDDTNEQSDVPEAISFSVAGTSVSEAVAISVYFNRDQDGALIKDYYNTYRLKPEVFVSTHLRDKLRGCFNVVVADSQINTPFDYQSQRIDVLSNVNDCIAEAFPFLVVENLEFLGKPDYPENIQVAIDAQFESEQKAKAAQAKARQAEAEAKAKVAEAQGDVEAEKIRASLASDPNYMEYRRLDIEEKRVEKWNGQYAPTIQTNTVQTGVAPE